MATTLLEQTRAGHEDLERLERLIVRDFKKEARTHRERLMQNHRVRGMLDTMQEQARKLMAIYKDEDSSRKEEIAALRGENVFSTFYDRLKDVRDYHRRYPDLEVTQPDADEELLKLEPAVEFSGEEGLGRYLDLHAHYHRFINARFGRQLDYVDFVAQLDNFGEIARAHRLSRPYREYLAELLSYLESFYLRTQPLGSLDKHYKPVIEGFEERWQAGQVAGWEDRGVGQAQASSATIGQDLEAFDTLAEYLQSLEPEDEPDRAKRAEKVDSRVKELLVATGLKAGGTAAQRAERLWSTRGKRLEELDRKLFAKGVVPAAAASASEAERMRGAARAAALQEAKVAKMCEVLGGVIEDTRANVEKKLARTFEELEAERLEAEQEEAEADSEEEDDYVYNPLKLPLGWDGKPIPYWLYKLHGLNQEFTCEICGNQSYWGRRAFERHFKEWRHQNGMRALGIPNNKNFFEVTLVKDAEALWKNMQEREKGGFKAEVEEEYEDPQGNVYNKKTYEDLKRQGLI